MSRIIILQLMIVQTTLGNIAIITKVPEVNQTAIISCYVPQPRFWYLPVGTVFCNSVECNPNAYGSYTFRADSTKTEFIFQSLNRSRDERVWACQHGSTNYTISLLIYTIPRGLDFTQTPDMNVDLGMTSITIQCRTTSCTYPEPSIELLYQDHPTSNTYEMYTRTTPSSTQGPCVLPEKIYTSSINLSRYTTWSDNSDKTVTFFCRIGYSDPSKNITSLASKTVSFAVRVTEAFIQQNNQNITSTLTVTSGEQFTLTCMTGTSRPAANIGWYIGSQSKGSGTSLIFTPSNTDHNNVIYCQVYNTDPNLKVDSNKPSLFVRVRVTEAFLQQNNQNITSTLTVTSGEQVTLTCVTGTSRPAPDINWYKGSQLMGSGTSLSYTPSNTDHNEVIYCQAYNIDPNLKVDSNKPSLFVRVRVTEAFLQYNKQNITSTLTVTSGEQVTLNCLTGTSRPAPNISWYIGSRSMGSGTNLTFTPSNNDHNNVIYCQAYNINPNLQVDSNKPSVFVRVRVTEAFLQQNNQNITSILNVTSGEQFTLTCVTGTSRPAPNIDWYIGSQLVGNATSLIFTPSNTNHNSVIYCQAYNPSPKVDSNKANLFVRVYVSSVTLDGSAGGTIVFTEGYPQTLKCISSPSRPVPTIRWFLANKQVTDSITNSDKIDTNEMHILTSEITLVLMRNSSNQKVYCEGFISGQGTTAMSTQVSVDVQYASDVKVNISWSTEVDSIAVLMCVPQGNPPQYTFHPWIHIVEQTEIRRLNGKNTFNFSTLTLSNISIQDMGMYICTVDNSITGLDGQVNQTGDTHVLVQGIPLIGETNSTFIGETNNSASIEIPFYSYSSVKTIQFFKRSDSSNISNTSDISFYTSPSKISMMFYKKNVIIPGYVAVLHFKNLKDIDFGNYTLEVSNQKGTMTVQFIFMASAPPSMPKKFFFSHTEGSFLVFVIEKGFNGGHEQTFIVQYQPFGMPHATWSTVSEITETGLDDPFSNGTYFIKIPKIQAGQYVFRVYAENKKGNTSTIEDVHVVEIMTEQPSPIIRELPVGAVVGGVVGAVVVVIVIVAVVFVVKRRTLRPKMEAFERKEMDSADGKHRESGLKDNPVYDSSDSGPVMQVDTAGVKPKRMFGQTEDPSKLYAQVDKTNKNKGKSASNGKQVKTPKAASKGKQVKTPRGDIYENTPLPLNLSGENVNKNPGHLEANSSVDVYENADTCKGQMKSKDAILYAVLKLGRPTTKNGKVVIHGLDNRTEYADIAYGKRGEPLPESDEEKENGGAKNDGTKSNTDE